jgi:hypothetical protein
VTNGTKPHRSHSSIKKSIDSANLRVTIASTFVAVVAAAAAIWSGYEAHQTRIDDERPFITPGPAEQLHPSPFVRIQIMNNGKSAAKKVHAICVNAVETPGSEVQWRPELPGAPSNFPFLLPTTWVKFNCPLTSQNNLPDRGTAVELGVVEYQDVRGNRYQTPFCYTFAFPYTDIDVHECNENRNLPDVE